MAVRRALGLLLAALLSWCPPAFADELREVSPALFVARDEDSTLYLFGTVHVRRPGAQWGGANARAALAEADEIWTEMEINPQSAEEVRVLTLRLGMAPADRPLSSRLSTAENERLQALAERMGAPLSMLEPMQPWLAALTLSILPLLRAGYEPAAGVDRAVVAAASGARLRAFETVEQQIGFFAGLSETAQMQMLLEAIDEADKGPGQLDDLSAAWERGDLVALQAAVVDEMRADYPELYVVLFKRRNTAWTEALVREFDGAGVDFVAVGAGHLLGEDGLVEMLRARGVQVERVGAE